MKYLTMLSVSVLCSSAIAQHDHEHGHANKHMHQTSFEELVERFEGPERDAYQQPQKVLQLLGDLQGKKIMDIGAGTGYFSFRLANAGATVIAADVDDRFLAYIAGMKKGAGMSDDRLTTRKVPYDSPALADSEVDMVIIVNTYHHIEDRAAYFAQVKNGLRPNGELVVLDFFKKELPMGPPEEMKISEATVQEELREAGFSKFDVNTDLLEYQFIIRAR